MKSPGPVFICQSIEHRHGRLLRRFMIQRASSTGTGSLNTFKDYLCIDSLSRVSAEGKMFWLHQHQE